MIIKLKEDEVAEMNCGECIFIRADEVYDRTDEYVASLPPTEKAKTLLFKRSTVHAQFAEEVVSECAQNFVVEKKCDPGLASLGDNGCAFLKC